MSVRRRSDDATGARGAPGRSAPVAPQGPVALLAPPDPSPDVDTAGQARRHRRRRRGRALKVVALAAACLVAFSAVSHLRQPAEATIDRFKTLSPPREKWGINQASAYFRSRGYIDDSCLMFLGFTCFRVPASSTGPLVPKPEATAQAIAINFLALKRLDGDFSRVDWEVGPSAQTPNQPPGSFLGDSAAASDPETVVPGEDQTDPCQPGVPGFVKNGNRWRIDIVADQRSIIEVKNWKNGDARVEVANQLACYRSYASQRGANFDFNHELNDFGFAVPFWLPNLVEPLQCVWAPRFGDDPDLLDPSGHIYFAPFSQLPPYVRDRCLLPAVAAALAAATAYGIARERLQAKLRPELEPAYQRLFSAQATHRVTVLQRPDSERLLRFSFGDGTSSTAVIVRGSGFQTATFSNPVGFRTGRYVQSVSVSDLDNVSLQLQAAFPPQTAQPLDAQAVTDVLIC